MCERLRITIKNHRMKLERERYINYTQKHTRYYHLLLFLFSHFFVYLLSFDPLSIIYLINLVLIPLIV